MSSSWQYGEAMAGKTEDMYMTVDRMTDVYSIMLVWNVQCQQLVEIRMAWLIRLKEGQSGNEKQV